MTRDEKRYSVAAPGTSMVCTLLVSSPLWHPPSIDISNMNPALDLSSDTHCTYVPASTTLSVFHH